MSIVAEKLDQERRDLLDLGLRNTLLNYRELKSKGVHIVDASPEEVSRALVDEGKYMSFLAMDNEQGKQTDNDEDQENSYELNLALEKGVQNTSLDKGQTKSHNTQLQTPYSSSRLQRRLLNTHYTARTAIEEQGVNILFLALGMLHWF